MEPMVWMRQFAIIAGISCLGEGLRLLIPLPIPASVYGLVLMLMALTTRLIRVDQVKTVSSFLISLMQLLFIPAVAALPKAWSVLAPAWLPVLFITVATTLLVMGVAGRVTQGVIRRAERRRPHD